MNEQMHLSPPGEVYLKQLEEAGGRCRLKAYDDGTGTPTIAWGCTHGVHMGMTITEAQGEAMFQKEIADIEEGLRKWLTRDVDQDTWDYCVFFGYNLGWGKCAAFKTAANSGNDAKMRAAAMLFTHARSNGKVVEWPGLVSRRKQELAYYDTHHNLTSAKLPTPVAVDGPKSQALPPPKPNIIVTAAKSRTVWAQLVGGVMTVCLTVHDYIQSAVNSLLAWPIPAADGIQGFVGDVQTQIDTSKQVAGWFHLNIAHIEMTILFLAIAFTIGRRLLDKHEAPL